MRNSIAIALLAVCSTMPAQAASYTYIDQKPPYGKISPPMLTALNLPKVGTTFRVQVPRPNTVGNCSPTTTCLYNNYSLALGVSNPNVSIPALGGFLFTSAEMVLPVVLNPNGPPAVTMSFPIPNSPQSIGVRFYQQVLWQSRRVSPFPSWPTTTLALSRGGVGVIGL